MSELQFSEESGQSSVLQTAPPQQHLLKFPDIFDVAKISDFNSSDVLRTMDGGCEGFGTRVWVFWSAVYDYCARFELGHDSDWERWQHEREFIFPNDRVFPSPLEDWSHLSKIVDKTSLNEIPSPAQQPKPDESDVAANERQPGKVSKPETIEPTLSSSFGGGFDAEDQPDQEYKDTQLIVSAAYGETERVRLFLQMGAQADARDNEPIVDAAANGHIEIIELLIEAGADVHANDGEPLVEAAEGGHINTVRFLLNKGASETARHAALRKAAEEGYSEILTLIENSASQHASSQLLSYEP